MITTVNRMMTGLAVAFAIGSAHGAGECLSDSAKLAKEGVYYVIEDRELSAPVEDGPLTKKEFDGIREGKQPTFRCTATAFAGFGHAHAADTSMRSYSARGYGKVVCAREDDGARWDPHDLPRPFTQPGGCSTAFMFTPWEKRVAARFFTIRDTDGNPQVFDNPNRTTPRSDGVIYEAGGMLDLFRGPNPFSPRCSSEQKESERAYRTFEMTKGLQGPITFGEAPDSRRVGSLSVRLTDSDDIAACRSGVLERYSIQRLATYQILDTVAALAKKPKTDAYEPSDVAQFKGLVADSLFEAAVSAAGRHQKFWLLAVEKEGPYSLKSGDNEPAADAPEPDFSSRSKK
jgi:hypothetical protein